MTRATSRKAREEIKAIRARRANLRATKANPKATKAKASRI